jgi:hypothetical protein
MNEQLATSCVKQEEPELAKILDALKSEVFELRESTQRMYNSSNQILKFTENTDSQPKLDVGVNSFSDSFWDVISQLKELKNENYRIANHLSKIAGF